MCFLGEKQIMIYRLAEETDIDQICALVKNAIKTMEAHRIFQWDDVYPAREDFLADIQKRQLFVGLADHEIAVVYVVNKESDEQYQNGDWNYPDSEYRVIHRLCVNPTYQNRGIAKSTLLHIEKELREAGVETIRLDVFSCNPSALSLYQKNGYQKTGHADWRKGRFYLMEKNL